MQPAYGNHLVTPTVYSKVMNLAFGCPTHTLVVADMPPEVVGDEHEVQPSGLWKPPPVADANPAVDFDPCVRLLNS
jgi:hypothetical protein